MRIRIELDIGVRKLEIDPEYGYSFRKFVEYPLRLQAQRDQGLSATCIRVLDYFFLSSRKNVRNHKNVQFYPGKNTRIIKTNKGGVNHEEKNH